jgi:ABC-type multidrug transport system ATPase subunit
MIEELRLINFKGFADQKILFRNFSVVVGRNNAGKSSAFDAIRIIATAITRFRIGKFTARPSWVDGSGRGVNPIALEPVRNPETLFFRYQSPPAVIEARFSNGSSIQTFIGEEGTVYAEASTPSGLDANTKARVQECEFPSISILPQIKPLEDVERVLRRDYVCRCIDTQLSSRHFRNQIRYMYDHFEVFRDLFQKTWEGLRISEFIASDAEYDDYLSLMLADDGFVAEISNFGHGLQMWLQIVWFISRTPSENIVVLDEPDVYMHPEQQQKLVQLLRERFHQTILSTHARPIIESCDEVDILRLHRYLKISNHGLDQATYESELEEYRAESVKRMKRKSVESKTSHKLRVALFDKATVTVWDTSEELVGSFECEKGEMEKTIEIQNGRYRVCVSNPRDVEIYVDGSNQSPDSKKSTWLEFILEVGNKDYN